MKVFVKRTFTKKFFLTFIILSLILIGYTKDKEINDILPFLDKGVGYWEKQVI